MGARGWFRRETIGTMVERIFDFLGATSWVGLPEHVQERAKLSLLDLIAVGLAARDTDLARIITAHAAEGFGGDTPFLFTPGWASALGVAMAGGMTIDAIDAHDGFNPAKGHIGCGLFPALYALAPPGLSGTEFLTAFVNGYEMGARLSITLHETAADYHTSGAWVAVAIALAGGQMAGLTPAQIAHAAGIAEYHGPRSQMMRCIDHPTMLKDGSGWGAMAGVSAVGLARAGFTGAPALTVEGPAWEDLGTRWYMTEQYYKPYPVCRWAQPPVEACLELQRRHGFVAGEIAGIEITTFHESTRLATMHPKSTEEAQYSTSFPVALALTHGRLGPEEVQGAAVADPAVHALSAKIVMREDDWANAIFPGRRVARVTVRLESGAVYESDWHEPKWDATAPASEAELRAKFREYVEPVVGRVQADAVEAAVMGLERLEAVELFGLITE
ncbi:MAG: MmgE/PrpD family protein [Pseudomonadota bacterium]